ncbi:hypothetical protein [Mesorhizobium loti]|uniref:hypothetical protein n=1 Tax=Rhizobium loti TaxID=381 RepID=UPI0012684D57|nr:hypothetical protein [Mesorhizobium loti]
MTAQDTPRPSYVIARSMIQSLAPQEIADIPDYEAAFELRRRGQATPDGLGLGMAEVILAVGPIAYFIGGKVIDKLTDWAVDGALAPVKDYLTAKGRSLLSHWLQNPRQGAFQGGLTPEGKAELKGAIRDACLKQNFDEGTVDRIIAKFADDL